MYTHNFSAFFTPYAHGAGFFPLDLFLLTFLPFIIIASLWTIVIKGYALWHAARAGQKSWFIALLVINTLGILEIIYLIWFRKTSHSHQSAVSSETES